jgi:hypothetical protein
VESCVHGSTQKQIPVYKNELVGAPPLGREALLAARELVAEASRAGQNQVPDAVVIGGQVDTVPFATVLPRPFRV